MNQESDVQQFMMPVTLPLVFGFVIAQTVALKAPHGAMAKLFSMIPLTSPIVMVVRAPFGVPLGELALSFGLLVLTFVLMVWLSSRIYRIGILSYGKTHVERSVEVVALSRMVVADVVCKQLPTLIGVNGTRNFRFYKV